MLFICFIRLNSWIDSMLIKKYAFYFNNYICIIDKQFIYENSLMYYIFHNHIIIIKKQSLNYIS